MEKRTTYKKSQLGFYLPEMADYYYENQEDMGHLWEFVENRGMTIPEILEFEFFTKSEFRVIGPLVLQYQVARYTCEVIQTLRENITKRSSWFFRIPTKDRNEATSPYVVWHATEILKIHGLDVEFAHLTCSFDPACENKYIKLPVGDLKDLANIYIFEEEGIWLRVAW